MKMPHSNLDIRHARGVTLVELMVGPAIGLLTVLVIAQTLFFSESQKRTTTSGADAQMNGALALYTLQRDIQMAGYGFASSPELLGCPISAKYGGANIATGAATPTFPTALVPLIIDATDPVRNTIRVLSSSKVTYSVPTRVIPPSYDPAAASKRYIFPVSSELGIAAGDLLLAAKDGSTKCEVFQASAAPTVAQQIDRADDGGRWNPAGFPEETYTDGNAIVNLGSLNDLTYSISANGSLQQTRFQLATDGTFAPSYTGARDLYPNIVAMQAFYGKDTNGDGVIDSYDRPRRPPTPGGSRSWRSASRWWRAALSTRRTRSRRRIRNGWSATSLR
ncbi:hypothetical protein FSC37_14445 [Piscinibacter aquaticus]|uniref:Pilus assembly protein PilW n=1 Tax=Piscinibacter aquaticus TaxID=392597 RepID=A0A5C6U3K5_9BURK|nr:hypothetical protein FSC37_14445 [Piscinibacter aquaticus]